MISLTGDTARAQAWFRNLQVGLELTVEEAVITALDELVRQLEPVTPVKTGAMKADYTIGTGVWAWELLDTAESPKGYPYPGRVFFDPDFSQSYGPLNRTLDAGIRSLDVEVDAALTRMVLAP